VIASAAVAVNNDQPNANHPQNQRGTDQDQQRGIEQ
jgi:hypothetical protein